MAEKALYSATEMRERLGIGETKFREEVEAGRLRVVHVGRDRVMVTPAAETAYIELLEAEGAGEPEATDAAGTRRPVLEVAVTSTGRACDPPERFVARAEAAGS